MSKDAKVVAKRVVYSDGRHPPRVIAPETGPGRTRQSEKESCDINWIVSQFKAGGMVSVDTRPGLYLDVSEMGDYREAVAQVEGARSFFMQLPSELRARFENDPAMFLDFVSDGNNKEEMAKLGLLGPEAAGKAAEKASSEAASAS